MEQTYTSKIDTWLLIVIVLSMAACLAVPFVRFQATGMFGLVVSLPIMLIGVGLPLWVYTDTRYRLTDTTLFANTGPFKWEIPLRDITKVTPTRDSMSGPALSFDRLRIDYGKGKSLIISPKQKQQFIDDLEQRRARSH